MNIRDFVELNYFLARFNEKMNFQNGSPTPIPIPSTYSIEDNLL